MKNGFTLVELSIVLVIIGLLIGGILVGQSLIDSAKINRAIRELSQYATLVSGFKSRYKQLPGDSTLFATSVGNNNGIVGEGTSAANPYYEEVGMSWHELSMGMGLKNSDGNSFSSFSMGTNLTNWKNFFPELSLDYNNLSNPHAVVLLFGYQSSVNGHGFQLRSASGGGYPQLGNGRVYAAWNSIDILALDSKLDDGNANTGGVYSYDEGSASITSCKDGSGNYIITTDEYNCATIIAMRLLGEDL